eukprot:271323-Amorphochlora_amoeboformis.AAC.1
MNSIHVNAPNPPLPFRSSTVQPWPSWPQQYSAPSFVTADECALPPASDFTAAGRNFGVRSVGKGRSTPRSPLPS